MNEINGDLLSFPSGIQVICHQANCLATMGAGIARQIREQFPEAAKADREAFNKNQAKLGLFSAVQISDDPPKYIVNLYGQHGIDGEKNTDYEGLYTSIDNLFKIISPKGYAVGFPKNMGCGLGGGDWRIVQSIIEVLMEKHGVNVTIVNYGEI